jgi:hypothetical protein
MIMYLAKIWIYQFPPPPRYKMFAVNDALLFLPEDYSIGWQGSHFGVLHFEKNYHYKTVSLHFQNSVSVDRKFVVKGPTRLQLFFVLVDFIPLHFFLTNEEFTSIVAATALFGFFVCSWFPIFTKSKITKSLRCRKG